MTPRGLPHDPAEATRLQMQRITDIVGIPGWNRHVGCCERSHRFAAKERCRRPILTAAIRQMGVQDYLGTAFTRAREANPQATLVINDYITTEEYMDKVIAQLVDLPAGHFLTLSGFNDQHPEVWSALETWDICERFAKVGKPLHFTEATMLSGQPGMQLKKDNPQFDWASTPEGERRQAEAVVQFYTILFSHPAVQAITWWDFSDQGAWQGAPAGFVRAE